MSEALEVRTTSDDASEGTNTLQSSATLVSGQLPTEAFALGETFRTIPDLTVESAPVAAAEEAASMPVMWAQTDDEDLTSTLAQDPSVTAIEELCRTGNRHFYRMSGPTISTVVWKSSSSHRVSSAGVGGPTRDGQSISSIPIVRPCVRPVSAGSGSICPSRLIVSARLPLISSPSVG